MRTERGFSLIEVLIAATIFAIGLLALAGAQLVSIRSNQGNYNFTVATNLVEQQLEELRANGPLAMATGSDGPLDAFGFTVEDYESNPPEDAKFMFNRSWTCVPNNPPVGTPCQITVQVTWTEQRTGQNRMVTSSTIITP